MTTPIPLTQAITAVQNGTLAQAIADVCAERDGAKRMAELNHAAAVRALELLKQAEAERDKLRKENEILQEANCGLARQCKELRAALASANALIGSTAEECKAIVSQCEKERDSWHRTAEEIAESNNKACDERDELQARCATLRSALEGLKHADGCYCDAAFAMPGTIVKHYDECLAAQAALATDTGKGYVPAARQLAEAVAANHKWHEDYDDDDYGGYPESDLCEQNLRAIATARELGLLEPPTQ
jgi:DNA anti-recombination protein RmuC